MWLMLRLLILESGSFDVGFVDFVFLMIKAAREYTGCFANWSLVQSNWLRGPMGPRQSFAPFASRYVVLTSIFTSHHPLEF